MTSKPETLYYCRTCQRHSFTRRGPHRNATTNLMCSVDLAAMNPDNCTNCNWITSGACGNQGIRKHTPWLGCGAWSKTHAVPSVPSVPSVAKNSSSLAPALITGDDQAVAAKFKELFVQAENAKFRVAAFGIYATHVKLNLLKHGQFYDWVNATIGEEHRRTVQDHMLFAKSTLERIGYRTLKAFFSNPQTLRICHSGEFLLLPEGEVPAEAKPIRDKVFSLFAGKSKYQLCSEWKQVEEDESGNVKTKVGRLKGHGGATKDQRAAKAAADAQAEKLELELAAKDLCKLIKTNCLDDKWGTKLPDAALQAVNDWCKAGFDYTVRILNARKKGPAAQ